LTGLLLLPGLSATEHHFVGPTQQFKLWRRQVACLGEVNKFRAHPLRRLEGWINGIDAHQYYRKTLTGLDSSRGSVIRVLQPGQQIPDHAGADLILGIDSRHGIKNFTGLFRHILAQADKS